MLVILPRRGRWIIKKLDEHADDVRPPGRSVPLLVGRTRSKRREHKEKWKAAPLFDQTANRQSVAHIGGQLLKLAPGKSTNGYATGQDATRIGKHGLKASHSHRSGPTCSFTTRKVAMLKRIMSESGNPPVT